MILYKLVNEANNERFNIDKQNQHLATLFFFFLKHYNVMVKDIDSPGFHQPL